MDVTESSVDEMGMILKAELEEVYTALRREDFEIPQVRFEAETCVEILALILAV